MPSPLEKKLDRHSLGEEREKLEYQYNNSIGHSVASARLQWASRLLENARKRSLLLSCITSLFLVTFMLHTCRAPAYSTGRFLTVSTVYPVHVVQERNHDVCTEPACIHAASEILYNLSPNYVDIDPCTNFDTFVCAGWDDRHDLRPDQGGRFHFETRTESKNLLDLFS